MLIRTRTGECEIYGLRCFYFQSRWFGEAFANVECQRMGRHWIDMWCVDAERTSYMLTIGRWMLSYGIPKWLFPKRHEMKKVKA